MGFFDSLAQMALPDMTGQGMSPEQVQAIQTQQTGTYGSVTGNLLGALSHAQFGLQAQRADSFQADQLRQNAGQVQASSQHAAADQDRQTQFMMSRAVAQAAGTGGSVSDPTVVNILARDAAEGAYRKSVALYQGDERAREMNMQASAKEYQGANTRQNSNLVAGAQILNSGASAARGDEMTKSLFQRYGNHGVQAQRGSLVPDLDIQGTFDN